MESEEKDQSVQQRIIDRFVSQHGWTEVGHPWCIVKKMYKTGVAPLKEAQLSLSFDRTNHLYYLCGEFVSAGENALGSCVEYIYADASYQEIIEAVDRFAYDAEKGISRSYCVRLIYPEAIPPDDCSPTM